MKLATYDDGSRDGQLVVVSRDLQHAHYASGIANTLQQVLDDWNFISPQLQDLYTQLNAGRARHAFPFSAQQCLAPLPRAYQWAHASMLPTGANLHHSASDDLLGPCHDIRLPHSCNTADMDAAIAIVTGDLPMGNSIEQALSSIRLVMLANAACQRASASHPHTDTEITRLAPAFSPVACTPDVLGTAWQTGRLHLTLQIMLNGRKFGLCDVAASMPSGFGDLLARLSTARRIRSGAIVSAGFTTPPESQDHHGYTSIANKRAAQAAQTGVASTDFLRDGDTVTIDMKGKDGMSLFGAIEQTVSTVSDSDH